jgi:PST family polysaccharide transporter/lipopolysaccharide exporter
MITEKALRLLVGLFQNGASVGQKALRGVVWLLLSNWITKSLSFIQTIILVRLLSPNDFGLFGILWVIVGTIETFTSTGVESALIQRKEIGRREMDTVWVIGLLRGIVKATLLFVSAPFVGTFYDAPLLTPITQLFALTYLFGSFRNVGMVTFSREMDYRTLSLVGQATRLLQMIATVTLVVILRDVWGLVLGYAIGEAISVVLSYLVSPYRPTFSFDLKSARSMFAFGRHILLCGVIIFLIERGDDALVGKVLGLETLGFYVLAYGLATMPSDYVTGILSQLTFTTFSRLQDEPEKLRASYLAALRFVSLGTIPASMGVALLAGEIIQVVYGPKWMPMVPALQMLCVFGMLKSIVSIPGGLFLGMGRPGYLTAVSAAQLVLMASVIYPLTTHFNIFGTSIAVTAPMVLVQGWAMKKSADLIGDRLSSLLKCLAVPVAGTGAMAVALIAAQGVTGGEITVLHLAGLIAFGAAVYAGAILAIDRELVRDVRRIVAQHT